MSEDGLGEQDKVVQRGTSGTNAQCLLGVAPVRTARPQARTQEHRQPRRSFVPTQPRSRWCVPHCPLVPGLLDSIPRRSRASASADLLGLFADRAERENCDARVHGRARQFRVERGGEVSDQFGLDSEAGQFRASESWPGSRLWLWSCPGRHAEHRAHIAPPGRAKPRGHQCWLGAHECRLRQSRQFAADGTNAAGACSIISGRAVSVAAAKLVSLPSCAGRTVRTLGAK
jgi:hypothetical protein